MHATTGNPGVSGVLPGTQSRLLIQAGADVADADAGLARWHGRARSWLAGTSRRDVGKPVVVSVEDLQGIQHYSAASTHPVIDLPLAAGTYHVNVSLDGKSRRYTVALEPGVVVELRVRNTAYNP